MIFKNLHKVYFLLIALSLFSINTAFAADDYYEMNNLLDRLLNDKAQSSKAEINLHPESKISDSESSSQDRSNKRTAKKVEVNFAFPLATYIQVTPRGKNHAGVDLASPIGTEVYAAMDGTVDSAGYRSGYGILITLSHQDGYETRYAHLSKVVIKDGEKVERGQLIGYVGMTGWTTGPHLHFEIRQYGTVVNSNTTLKYISVSY